MSSLDDLFAQIPIAQVAQRLGVDTDTANNAVRQALPALVGGMQANAQDPAGAASLEGALQQHAGAPIDDGIDLDKVDTSDGQKIVGNVFGGSADGVAHALGSTGGGVDKTLISKLLPMLAPIVLAWLGKRLTGGGSNPGQQSGGGLGDLLGGMLGGGSGGGFGGLGDVLGGLLGGGKR